MSRCHHKPMLLLLILSSVAVAVCVFFQCSGKISTGFHGFGVDSKENIYVGKDQKIDVYYDQQLLYSFSFNARAYKLAIQDDLVLLAAPEQTTYMDLYGNQLKAIVDNGTLYRSMPQHPKEFVSSTGKHYLLKNGLIKSTILCEEDGTVLYTTPLPEQIMQIVFPISIIVFISAGASCVLVLQKNQRDSQ